ncbi:hypothetical protein QBC46DRAFT_435072 [Diplogelasinospora grovesii]|uniref:Uncharacterized protein n=1 Tax=Diplogelasinospora grovesii TaxID=303347 RepID=A0AAN6S573_9PEZI|nr:hypothetical protein QBC46DRAFT_435072 [Diplogelasinospora grovesii]
MQFAATFAAVAVGMVWSMISFCVALYYMSLLPHEARRRWPILDRDSCLTLLMPIVLFLLAFTAWPVISVWDYCVHRGHLPGSYRPCISDKVYDAERARRRQASIRIQEALPVLGQPPGSDGMRW